MQLKNVFTGNSIGHHFMLQSLQSMTTCETKEVSFVVIYAKYEI